ncbi:MAG: peptidoglycan-associated lipoprotein Pal [Burkholderiales bacterium]|jgi:peptidoglycan-associated lipoprotein|nr:peptidoglycan-associated lipoprotein Pal [Burkholderiales bacterium]
MKNAILLLALAALAAGCATQDVQEQRKAAVEQRDLLETQRKSDEEAKRAQIAREQEELNRQLEEQKQRQAQMQDTAEVKPLAPPGGSEKPLGDLRSQLKDPGGPLFKRSIYYDYDRYDVKEDYRALVEAHAKFMLDNKEVRMRVEGNCDERGSTEYNLALGQRRADGVKRALMVLGVPANRIEAVSYGEEKPKAAGQDDDSYSENRRSDIVYPGFE